MATIQPGGGWWLATDGEWYPPRWEYLIVEGYPDSDKRKHEFQAEIVTAGQNGWELVSVVGPPTNVGKSQAYFKRQIRP